MTRLHSRWRAEAERIIRETLAALPPDATRAQTRQALRDAYPFGEREHHPYKVWCAAVRDAVGRRFAAEMLATPERPRIVLRLTRTRTKGRKILAPPELFVDCPWCRHLPDGCLVCSPLSDRVVRIATDPEFRSLAEGATDDTSLAVLQDWLEERGVDTRGKP